MKTDTENQIQTAATAIRHAQRNKIIVADYAGHHPTDGAMYTINGDDYQNLLPLAVIQQAAKIAGVQLIL